MRVVDKEQVTEDILDAVIRCKYEAKGGNVQITQISSLVGISDRTLNRYFPDKELMIYLASLKMLRLSSAELLKEYRARIEPGMNGKERFLLLVKTQIDKFHSESMNALMFASAVATCVDTAISKKICYPSYDNEVERAVVSDIEIGKLDGSVRSDVDPADVYCLTSSSFNGLAERIIYLCNVGVSDEEQKKKLLCAFDDYLDMIDCYISPKRL